MTEDYTVETPDNGSEPVLDDLLADLRSESEQTRLDAVQALRHQKSATTLALRSLEKTAVQDSSRTVRQAALEALAAPAYRETQRHNSRLPLPIRKSILTELEQWQTDGLLTANVVAVLRQRYTFDPPAAAPATASSKTRPSPSLSEVLLSETTIKVALYLGAFFVLAAAAILAAVIEGLRLPILGAATLGFVVAALALKRRLPQASFVLFVIFSFLLPIDAGVFLDLFEVSQSTTQLYWIGVTSLVGAGMAGRHIFLRLTLFQRTDLGCSQQCSLSSGALVRCNYSFGFVFAGAGHAGGSGRGGAAAALARPLFFKTAAVVEPNSTDRFAGAVCAVGAGGTL